jgi:hypothetical protein
MKLGPIQLALCRAAYSTDHLLACFEDLHAGAEWKYAILRSVCYFQLNTSSTYQVLCTYINKASRHHRHMHTRQSMLTLTQPKGICAQKNEENNQTCKHAKQGMDQLK